MTEVQKQALEAPIDPAQETMRYKDASLPVKERVEDLLGRMTLREKVGQLNQRLYGFAAYERKGDTITLTEETIREAEYFGGLGVVYGLYRADPWSAKTKENGLTPEYAAKGYIRHLAATCYQSIWQQERHLIRHFIRMRCVCAQDS